MLPHKACLPYVATGSASVSFRLGARCGNQARPWLSKPSSKSGSFAMFAAIHRASSPKDKPLE
jgi:hypothetical protein